VRAIINSIIIERRTDSFLPVHRSASCTHSAATAEVDGWKYRAIKQEQKEKCESGETMRRHIDCRCMACVKIIFRDCGSGKLEQHCTIARLLFLFSYIFDTRTICLFLGLFFHVVGEGVVNLARKAENVTDKENYIDFRLRLLGEPGEDGSPRPK
jgi:hypothetical protein